MSEVQTGAVSVLSKAIGFGITTFLTVQYLLAFVFVLFFGVVVIILVSHVGNAGVNVGSVNRYGFGFDRGGFTSIAYGVAAITGIVTSVISSKMVSKANEATLAGAAKEGAAGWNAAFNAAYNAGGAAALSLFGFGLIMLYFTASLFGFHFDATTAEHCFKLFGAVTGFGLGASAVALFSRFAGGVFTASASMGAHLVGRAHPALGTGVRNPASVLDTVSDNVGNAAALNADLLASVSEATVAAMLLSSTSTEIIAFGWAAQTFPMVISATGVFLGVFMHFVGTDVWPANDESSPSRAAKTQLLFATGIATAAIWPILAGFLPNDFHLNGYHGNHVKSFFAIAVGLWSAFVTSIAAMFFTSPTQFPVAGVAKAADVGGFVLPMLEGMKIGTQSIVSSLITASFAVYVSFHMLGAYGVALAALGYLLIGSTVASLGFLGPVSESANTLADIAVLPEDIKGKVSKLSRTGNATIAVAKAYTIGSSVFVTLALIGAFAFRVWNTITFNGGDWTLNLFCGGRGMDVLQPVTFACLIAGAMLPHFFLACNNRAVGSTASLIVKEVNRQVRDITGDADNTGAAKLVTSDALKGALLPIVLIHFAPLFVGILWGANAVVGLLSGALVSGVALSLSQTNTGSVWDSAKKYVADGKLKFTRDNAEVVISTSRSVTTPALCACVCLCV